MLVKITSILVLMSLSLSFAGAEYNPDKVVNSDGPSTKMITTTSIKIMHQSWDLNLDGINDCENDGTCDDSIDYTKAKTYLDKNEFLEAEGYMCQTATDSCNTIGVYNGAFTFSTEMWCEDVYGENGVEKYSCNSYNEERIEKMKYIRQDIYKLTEEKPVLGGNWYVTNIEWKSDDEIIVDYEDGHIVGNIVLSVSDLEKGDDMRICTMEYAPVCAVVQVQCIKAPCYPVEKTFGNKCMAGDNKILYKGECGGYIDYEVYSKYYSKKYKFVPIIEKLSTIKLEKLLELIDEKIETTKLLRFSKWMQQEKITAYVFLRDLINIELENR